MPSTRLALRGATALVVAAVLAVAMWARLASIGDAPTEVRTSADALSMASDRVLPTRASPKLSTPPSWLPAELSVEVLTMQGQPVAHARVESDCGWSGRTDLEGRWIQLLSPAECEVRAVREDGLLRVRSDEERVHLAAGQATQVLLKLPDDPQGGIGVAVAPHADGLEVLAVRPDSPAALAEMRSGQVLVEVDGQSTLGWTASEFSKAGIGSIGSRVALGVTDDDTGHAMVVIELERAWLPPGKGAEDLQAVSLASLTDAQRREVAAIRESLGDLYDGEELDLDDPSVRALVDRVHAIADSTD